MRKKIVKGLLFGVYTIGLYCLLYATLSKRCKGEKGDPGPQGMTGQKGDKGEPGQLVIREVPKIKSDKEVTNIGDPATKKIDLSKFRNMIGDDPGEVGPQGKEYRDKKEIIVWASLQMQSLKGT